VLDLAGGIASQRDEDEAVQSAGLPRTDEELEKAGIHLEEAKGRFFDTLPTPAIATARWQSLMKRAACSLEAANRTRRVRG
jgi:hypothetical protein